MIGMIRVEREPLEKSATFPVSERLLGLAPYHMTLINTLKDWQ